MSKVYSSHSGNPQAKWILWGVYTLCIVLLASRHEFWYDEYHVWFLARFLSFKELFRTMTSEGHFLLWFLPVRVLSRLGCSFWCLHLLSVSLASAAAWLLIMKGPFDLLSQGLIIFSYPLVYWFPVISRCYALIPIILFAIAYLYSLQGRHIILYAFFVGLLAHTHAYMEGLVAALFLLFCYEQIMVPHRQGRPVYQGIIGAVVIVLLVFLAFLQVYGSLAYGQSNLSDRHGVLQTVIPVVKAYSLIPVQVKEALKAGHINVLALGLLAVTVILWAVTLFLVIKVFIKQKAGRKFAVVLSVSVLWQVLLSITVFQFAEHRVYLPMLLIVYTLWCIYGEIIRRESLFILASLFLLTVQCDLMIQDIRKPFCPDTAVYASVKRTVPPGSRLFVVTAPGCPEIIKEYEIPLLMKTMFDYEYDASFVHPLAGEDYQRAVADELGQEQSREVWCVLVGDADIPSHPWYVSEVLDEVAGYRLCRLTAVSDTGNR